MKIPSRRTSRSRAKRTTHLTTWSITPVANGKTSTRLSIGSKVPVRCVTVSSTAKAIRTVRHIPRHRLLRCSTPTPSPVSRPSSCTAIPATRRMALPRMKQDRQPQTRSDSGSVRMANPVRTASPTERRTPPTFVRKRATNTF